MIFIVIAAAVFLLDYFVKKWADKNLPGKPRKNLGKTGFSLKLTHNYGFACNKLDKKPELVKAIHLVVMAILGAYSLLFLFFRKGKEWMSLGMALILGGGLSNLYDRWKKGYVVDYLGLPGIKKLLFNISDLFIFLGSILLLIKNS